MNRALQVLGFLLSLARGSEVGNSQAGKRRGSTGGLRTRDSEPDSWGAGGQWQELGLREAGVRSPRRLGPPGLGTVRMGFSAWSGRGRDSGTCPPATASWAHRRPSDLSLRRMLKPFTLLRDPAGMGTRTSIL